MLPVAPHTRQHCGGNWGSRSWGGGEGVGPEGQPTALTLPRVTSGLAKAQSDRETGSKIQEPRGPPKVPASSNSVSSVTV